MLLTGIEIENYRSIEKLSFDISDLEDGSSTYAMVGVNEVGKSSILRAVGLKDGLQNDRGEALPILKDFKDKTRPIKIVFHYSLGSERDVLADYLATSLPELDSDQVKFDSADLVVTYNYASPGTAEFSAVAEVLTINEEFRALVIDHLTTWLSNKVHRAIFWKPEERFLISQPISLSDFALSPASISIPLRNCFALIDVVGDEAIRAKVAELSESTTREQLRDELGQKVTDHITARWPEHKIKITFDISDGLIHFHVHDLETKSGAKTADQRSDGFRQLVSFLLTISAQSSSEELTNTILLLDEPETHLHPQAQEDLLKELINITKSDRNNICFFATHSNYMIDKDDLSRTHRVVKEADEDTKIEKTSVTRFDKKTSTYASVSYEVFDIPSSDYVSELYGILHEYYIQKDPEDINRASLKKFDNEFFVKEKKLSKKYPWKDTPNAITLPTYVRNCINHPEGGRKASKAELIKVIEQLRPFMTN